MIWLNLTCHTINNFFLFYLLFRRHKSDITTDPDRYQSNSAPARWLVQFITITLCETTALIIKLSMYLIADHKRNYRNFASYKSVIRILQNLCCWNPVRFSTIVCCFIRYEGRHLLIPKQLLLKHNFFTEYRTSIKPDTGKYFVSLLPLVWRMYQPTTSSIHFGIWLFKLWSSLNIFFSFYFEMKDNNEDNLMKIMFAIVLYLVLTEHIFEFVAKFVVNLKKRIIIG